MQINALCKNGPALVADKPGKRLLTRITGIKITRQTLLCMKITAFILFAFCIQVSATTLAQNVTLSEHKAPLEKVINEIKRQTGYSFFYNQDWLQQAQPVVINVKNVPLNEALKACFANQPFSYAIVNKTIVLKLKEKTNPEIKLLVVPVNVSGKVTDTAGVPLPGATLRLKNEGKTYVSQNDGTFLFGAQSGEQVTVSFIGYTPYTFTVAENMPFQTVVLRTGENKLSEVVVSTGYEQLPLERATGSFAKVDNKLFNQRVSSDVLSRLEGNVPGLIFNKNTSKGANGGVDINIRGHNTLFSNDQPLIVVDNFAYDGDINNINPNDVESVTVLKDAAAASVWGVRSGNGVIVITTKKGRRNQPMTIGINSNLTVGSKPNLYYSRNFLNAADYIDVEKKLFDEGTYDYYLSDPTYVVTPAVRLFQDNKLGLISDSEVSKQIEKLKSQDARDDLSKYLYRHSFSQQYALNLNGGSNNSDYYLSIGYDKNLGSEIGVKDDRLTINSTSNYYPTKKLQLSLGINYIQNTNVNNGGISSGILPFPYLRLTDDQGNPAIVEQGYPNAFKDSYVQQGYLNWNFIPLIDRDYMNNVSKQIDNRFNVGAKYDIITGLNFNINYQYENLNTQGKNYNSVESYQARNLINRFAQIGSDGKVTFPIPVGGILNSSLGQLSSHQYRGQVNFSKDWNNKSQLNAIAGVEIRHSVSENSTNIAYGYNDETKTSIPALDYLSYFNTIPYGSEQIPNYSGFGKGVNNFLSYYSNASYVYNNKYVISASGRIDQSNFFGLKTNQKAVPLYSLGIGWNISNENFYNIKWLPLLKARMTYGYNGNINTTTTAITTIRDEINAPFNGIPFASIQNPGNPRLRWERNRMINLGIDFGTKDNRVTGSVEAFYKKSVDLFGNSPIAPTSGLLQYFGNVAGTKGHGIDVALNSNNLRIGRFQWESRLMYNYVVDKVAKYDVKSTVSTYINQNAPQSNIVPLEGADVYGVYSYKWAGLDPANGDPMGYLDGKLSKNYAAILASNSFDNLNYSGPARPRHSGSLRNTLSFGNLSLSVNITGKFGYYFRRESISNVGDILSGGQGNADYLMRWQQPGDEQHTTVPSIQYTPFDFDRATFYKYSSVLVTKGDHIRIQDITVNYQISRNQWKKLPFRQMSIYSYVNNVGIIWRANKLNMDPDLFNGYGIPPVKTWTFGIKGNF